MPRWPGLVIAIIGALVALVGLGGQGLVDTGQIESDGWLFAAVAAGGMIILGGGLLYSAVRQLRMRRYLSPERYRGPGVLVLLLLGLALGFLAAVPFRADARALAFGEGEAGLLGAIVLLVSTQLALLLVSWSLVFRPGALAALPSLPGRDPGRAIWMGLGWGLVAWVGSSIVGALVVVLLDAVGIEPTPQVAERALRLVEPWVAVVAAVVVAPIAEEVFFRGVVFNALRREGGRRWAYIGSSALFAVIHVSLAAVVPIFLLGLALAWVYERTNNLLAPIAMHAMVNGIAVAVALLVRFEVIPLPT